MLKIFIVISGYAINGFSSYLSFKVNKIIKKDDTSYLIVKRLRNSQQKNKKAIVQIEGIPGVCGIYPAICLFIFWFPIIGKQAEKNGFNSAELHTDHLPKFREARAELMNSRQQKQPPNKLSGGCDRKGLSSH